MNGSTLQESTLDSNALDPVRPTTVVGPTISLLVCQKVIMTIKSQLGLPRLFDHWFDLDQSYQTGRSLVENCSQSPPGPDK